jgi:hypothetical protein
MNEWLNQSNLENWVFIATRARVFDVVCAKAWYTRFWNMLTVRTQEFSFVNANKNTITPCAQTHKWKHGDTTRKNTRRKLHKQKIEYLKNYDTKRPSKLLATKLKLLMGDSTHIELTTTHKSQEYARKIFWCVTNEKTDNIWSSLECYIMLIPMSIIQIKYLYILALWSH